MLRKVITHIKENKRNINPVHKLLSALVSLTRNQHLTGGTLQKTLRLLQRICTTLNENGIHYWVEGGTLLGIIRENRLLPWDHDIDISVNIADAEKVYSLLRSLKKYGFTVDLLYHRHDLGPFKKGMCRKINIRNKKFLIAGGDVLADIFIKLEEKNNLYWTIDPQILKSTPGELTKEVTVHDFNGINIKIPKQCNEYLSYRYGEWQVPVKEYDGKTDDRSIIN